ncbi:MAG: hypothetical protein LBK02_03675 [Treponema sp.]|jgi:hypothetical protein|nr:hypothetical protein [Treponema sp.]
MKKAVLLTVLTMTVLSCSLFGGPKSDTGSGPKGAIHVTGPITGGEHGWPFMGYFGNISRIGYVEEEFFIEGNAAHYDLTGEWTNDGKWTLEKADAVPYKTRVLVQRPADPAGFNGTVIVEWSNVSNGYDWAFVELEAMMDMADCGFAYALVSTQPIGIYGFKNAATATSEVRAVGTNMTVQAAPADLAHAGLVTWDPQRYGSLNVPDDGVSYDIFTQAGIALGPNRKTQTTGVDTMGGLDVKKLIAVGGSQSGIRLLSYANGVQPLANVYDAIIPGLGGGQGVDFKAAVAEDRTAPDPNPVGRRIRPALIRDDLSIPVMIFNSEAEADWTAEARQPETGKLRHWEVPGSSHAGPRKMQFVNRKSDREGITNSLNVISVIRQTEVDWQPVLSAAFWAIHQWITDGAPPPSFPPIETTVTNGRIELRRDQYGNALGGVRLPELEVPFANYSVVYRTRILPSSYTIPFSTAYLKQLYPTHDDYVAKVTEAVNKAKAAGILLERSANEYIRKAQAVPVPEMVYPEAIRQYLK